VDFTDDDSYIAALITASRDYAEKFTRRAFVTQQWQLSLDNFPSAFGYGTVMGNPGFGMGYAGWIPGYGRGGNVNIWFANGVVELPYPRLQTVDEIKYIDRANVLQTLDPTTYQVDAESEPGRIAPITTQIWPFTELSLLAPALNAITLKFTCGYGRATTLTGGVTFPAATLNVVSTTGFPTSGSLKLADGNVVTYTGVTATSFTGCTGGTAGVSESIGAAVVWDNTPPTIVQALKLIIGHWYANRETVITGTRAAAVEVPFAADTLLWANRIMTVA
jgi:hypothetical protein